MSFDTNSFHQLSCASPKELVLCSQREARDTISFEQARQLKVLPLSILQRDGKRSIVVATTNPNAIETAQAIRFITGLEAQLFSIPETVLTSALFEVYHREGGQLVEISNQLRTDVDQRPAERIEHSIKNVGSGDAGKLLSALLDMAFAQKASDVQLSPRRDGFFLTLRVGGQRRALAEPLCSLSLGKKLVNKIKILSLLDSTVHNVPQDGSFEMETPEGVRSVRVSFLPTIHGAQIALRLFGEVAQQELGDLFTDPKALQLLLAGLQERSGLVLLAGATGSGKTTTLYAAMRHLHKKGLNIVSIEDPAEAEIGGISQTSINAEVGLTYSTALKSALRQDPDVILIGEIRDAETARIACEAALTGHLVLSTVHGGNVKEALIRLRQLVGKNMSLLDPLRLIITQKLVPELCPSCRVLDLTAANRFSIKANKAVGCGYCDYTGVATRLCVVEAFYTKGVDLTQLHQQRIDELEAEGLFVSPKQQLVRLFTQGRIDVETVSREAFDSIW